MGKFIDITLEKKEDFNKIVSHPLQSFEWGEFRKKTGVKVILRAFVKNKKIIDGFTLTLHKIPKTSFYIGYLPKGNLLSREMFDELYRIGKEERCVYVQLEPNVVQAQSSKRKAQNLVQSSKLKIYNSFHPLFTKYTFVLDLTKTEDELLRDMQSKTRYNIKIAQKRGVQVMEDNSDEAFETYLKLTEETTRRQKFYAHTEKYHRLMWESLKRNTKYQILNTNQLTAHLLTAQYKNKILVAWILFTFRDTLYYPYGASSTEYREVMASNLMMWEAIRFGKKLGLSKFDMWGALGPDPDTSDPWYGFHRFKQGYGAELVEFVGSYDLVIDPLMYRVVQVADKARWFLLKMRRQG